MNKIKVIAAVLLCLSIGQSCYNEEKVTVTANFTVTVQNGATTVPATVTVENTTTGADYYQWTFEGGEPATFTNRQPSPVRYTQAGSHTIRLEAWNDDNKQVKEYTLRLDSVITAGFTTTIAVNNFAPVTVNITNTTVGADTWQWTFNGGTPASYNGKTPPPLTYAQAGEYTITLEASNSGMNQNFSQTITVLPPLAVDFDFTPAFDSEDMQAPVTATLRNNTISGLTYKWSVSANGAIENTTAAETTNVYLSKAGEYVITLEATNGKQVKTQTKTITVYPNTNLYVLNNVKIGINSAHAEIGSFFSGALRKVLTKSEVTATTSPQIDIVLFGLDETFDYCRFLSPDSAGYYAFADIAQARTTKIINVMEAAPLVGFTSAQFDEMTTDAPLQPLPIAIYDTGARFFTKSVTPRFVLFQTHDGRKGVIKIKQFIINGKQSYILTDIKIQKQPNP